MRVTHVIFDLDGLLLDTESLYTKATQKIFDRYGKTFDWSIKSKIMGRKPLDAAKHVVEMAKLPLDAADFNEELYKSLETVFPEAQLMPGAAALVKHLQTCGIPLAVATGSSLHTYQLKVSAHSDVFSCFHHVVCSDDSEVKNGKPSPDIYLTAAKRY
jgi:pseudouridine-5'-monophosphatase